MAAPNQATLSSHPFSRAVRTAVVLALVPLTAMPAGAPGVAALTPACPSRDRAVLLVGGFGEDWRHFEPWLAQLEAQGLCVFGFEGSFRELSLPAAAQHLRDKLWALQDQGFVEVTVLAHSMGGLAARRAVQLMAERAQSGDLSVRLHTYGTPWGGYFWANFVRWTPGLDGILSSLGFPMSTDIGTSSAFMKALQEPLPPNVTAVVHHSEDDTVAVPQSVGAHENFSGILDTAHEVRLYQGLGHSDFVGKLSVQF